MGRARVKWVGRAACMAGVMISLAGVTGCGNDASGEGSGASAGPQKPGYSDDAMAFMLGRKYAFACLYTRLDKPAEANSAIQAAQTLARALGVTPPSLPAKEEAFGALRAKAIPEELSKKKSAKLSAVFSLGVAVTDAWFGTLLGSDPSPAVAEIESNARAAGLAESVYKAQLDAVKAKATDDGLEKLAAALEAHYKK